MDRTHDGSLGQMAETPLSLVLSLPFYAFLGVVVEGLHTLNHGYPNIHTSMAKPLWAEGYNWLPKTLEDNRLIPIPSLLFAIVICCGLEFVFPTKTHVEI